MLALLRTISPYSGASQLLGVYTIADAADSARAAYLGWIECHGDPHAEQAYRTVDVAADTRIEPLEGEHAAGSVVLVVSQMAEGFGQIVRVLKTTAATLPEARRYAEALEADLEWGEIERLVVDAPPLHILTMNHANGPAIVSWSRES
jgi:hypothetical protein